MIIKLRDGAFIKTENITKEGVWGWRWNKNEQRFAEQCIYYYFFVVADESDLPKALPRLEIDE